MQTPFSKMLQSVLSKAELVALAITVIGLILFNNGQEIGSNILTLGLTTLAGIFFLTAFMPASPASDDENQKIEKETKKGFVDLIGLVLWKVMHIGCAVTTIGILFYILHLLGFGQMLFIGTSALILSVAFSALSILQKSENMNTLKSGLMRAIPLVLLGSYILYMNWPVS